MSVLFADSLNVRSSDGTYLLRNVSLDVRRGETLLLCGPPGSGKTVLAKALAGLLDTRQGLNTEGHVQREGSIGFLFQNSATQLVRRVVEHDVAFGLENRSIPLEKIENRIDHYTDLFDANTLLDRRIDELSMGEVTKVALLGILVTEPDVVILDEPLASLDFRNSRIVLEAVDRLRDVETTIIVIEHDARDLLDRADRIGLVRSRRVKTGGVDMGSLSALYEAGVKLPVSVEIGIEVGNEREIDIPSSEFHTNSDA